MDTLEEYLHKGSGRAGFREIKEIYKKFVVGEIDLVDPSPPRSFMEYIIRLDYSLWLWITIAFSSITMLLILFSWIHPLLTILRYVMGSIFILYLPGYVVIEALYPSEHDLRPLERLALSIGISLAVVPLLGLLLNYTPWGIRLVPVSITLFIFIAMIAIVAAHRKYVVARLEAELINRRSRRGS